ncbi:MAG TPA: tetratricopeptide repeat protein, partial [Thermoanaerobaculia bacterium]|nr:tetratricopeptide repeat protein [Thermoanaerobaculia bacterium]
MYLSTVVTLLLPLAACSGNAARQPDTSAAQLTFGVSMAQRGLWQEALFRFREAERLDPQNPRVHNNLGVAYEAAGDFESALKHYKRALEIAPDNRQAKANYARFVEFYQSFKAKPGDKKASAFPTAAPPTKQPPRRPPSPPTAPLGPDDPGIPGEPRLPGVPPPPPP